MFRFRSFRSNVANRVLCLLMVFPAVALAEPPRRVSGIDPKLAVYNQEGECGIGAVVPWADRLWVITYAPHRPQGSTDRLYEITPDFQQIIRQESQGGTPANRMIHPESNQLFIGPYVIDAERQVRVIPSATLFGRLTGNARHLSDPANKIYYATMEEGIYEVDVKTLDVTELWTDEHKKTGHHAKLPGYHGKGLYSGQGLLVYANNGERGDAALRHPETPSGVLATWNGTAPEWTVVRRNQFTEVTGPGGLTGNGNPETDPIWSIGWDHRSLILQVLSDGKWFAYRLPKSSHSYDGAHGWNTEWPRIREIGETDLLMTMHGAFWRFPRHFSPQRSSGIAPRSNYLKVIGDFCRWGDEIVLGCDDAAHSEFLNKRKLKGETIPAGQSHSNLLFLKPEQLDDFGPGIGRGSVWKQDDVAAGTPSDPFLFAGYDRRFLELTHESDEPIRIRLEVDRDGTGEWTPLKTMTVHGRGAIHWMVFSKEDPGVWIRLVPEKNLTQATAVFQYANADSRSAVADPLFNGIAAVQDTDVTGGLLHSRGADLKTLRFVARSPQGKIGGYELDGDLKLARRDDAQADQYVEQKLAIPAGVIEVDAASVLYVDDSGRRWRLPKSDQPFPDVSVLGPERICREVCTERDLLNIQGTFYELPAENAGGFAKIRPVSTHNRRISDFTSYRGLLVMSGLRHAAATGEHIIRSEDGLCSLWAGQVDDLWKLGKPRGVGGPWNRTLVRKNVPSDPYLMTGYNRKQIRLSHELESTVVVLLELDLTGDGLWSRWQQFEMRPGQTVEYEFPEEVNAYWLRLTADQDTTATAIVQYD